MINSDSSAVKLNKVRKTNLQYGPNNKHSSVRRNLKYYCHYQNAIYMGGTDSFLRNGKGIMLLDNGSCLLTQYCQNKMTGHNIIFHDNCLISKIMHDNCEDICIRYSSFVLTFKVKNQIITGKGYEIDFEKQRIFQLLFQRSVLIRKVRILNKKIQEEIFIQKQLKRLIEKEVHIKTMNLDFSSCDLFTKNQENGLCFFGYQDQKQVNGLGFNVFLSINNNKLEVKLKERGLFQKSCLAQFGRIQFQNGKYYYGQIYDNKFNGRGILVDETKDKWIYGKFLNSQLIEIIRSSNPKENKIKNKLWRVFEEVHKFQRKFINQKINISPSIDQCLQLLQVIINQDNFEHFLQADHKNNKKQYLKQTLNYYITGQQAQQQQSIIEINKGKLNQFNHKQQTTNFQQQCFHQSYANSINQSQAYTNKGQTTNHINEQQTRDKRKQNLQIQTYFQNYGSAIKRSPLNTDTSHHLVKDSIQMRKNHLNSKWREYLVIRNQFQKLKRKSSSKSHSKYRQKYNDLSLQKPRRKLFRKNIDIMQ